MSPIAIAAIIMLVLLFLNVPVFASVLGACVTYFVLNPSAGLDGMLAMPVSYTHLHEFSSSYPCDCSWWRSGCEKSLERQRERVFSSD